MRMSSEYRYIYIMIYIYMLFVFMCTVDIKRGE